MYAAWPLAAYITQLDKPLLYLNIYYDQALPTLTPHYSNNAETYFWCFKDDE